MLRNFSISQDTEVLDTLCTYLHNSWTDHIFVKKEKEYIIVLIQVLKVSYIPMYM
jgi:hypothetical protein